MHDAKIPTPRLDPRRRIGPKLWHGRYQETPFAQKAPPPEVVAEDAPPLSRPRRILRWIGRGLAGTGAFYLLLILLFSFLPPPINLYQISESWRLGGISKDWVKWGRLPR